MLSLKLSPYTQCMYLVCFAIAYCEINFEVCSSHSTGKMLTIFQQMFTCQISPRRPTCFWLSRSRCHSLTHSRRAIRRGLALYWCMSGHSRFQCDTVGMTDSRRWPPPLVVRQCRGRFSELFRSSAAQLPQIPCKWSRISTTCNGSFGHPWKYTKWQVGYSE